MGDRALTYVCRSKASEPRALAGELSSFLDREWTSQPSSATDGRGCIGLFGWIDDPDIDEGTAVMVPLLLLTGTNDPTPWRAVIDPTTPAQLLSAPQILWRGLRFDGRIERLSSKRQVSLAIRRQAKRWPADAGPPYRVEGARQRESLSRL